MHDVIVGGALLASFVGGMVALFAPCCISVMLPAYFATSFGRRRALVSMTFVFAAGVAAIVVPISLGASWVSRAVSGHHRVVFTSAAVAMMAMGVATLRGWKPALPMIGLRARSERGPAAVFSLGLFSGLASACCAPVLAGVVAVSGAAGSFPVALAVGVAYVFGMVGPLFVIALAWDRYRLGERALMSRTVTVGGRRLSVSAAAGGLLLMAMAVLTFVLALTGPSMATTGWQAHLSARLGHYAHNVTSALSAVPGWITATALAAGLGGLAWIAIGEQADRRQHDLADPELGDEIGRGGIVDDQERTVS